MQAQVNLEPVPVDDEAFAADTRLREANRAVVEQYLAIHGAENYEQRLALMTDDVMYEQVFTMDLLPERTCGKNKVRERFEHNAKCWDEFAYTDIAIRDTDRPDTFLVECDVDGTMTNPMFKGEKLPRPYHNYYYVMFVLTNGKIRQLRQFTNPMKQIHDFWKEMPNSVG